MTGITPEKLDEILSQASRDVTVTPRIIWTAGAIARRIGTSPDFVRDRLAKEPGSPVRQIGGRYCAIEQDLIAFFRTDAA
ncbi:MAG TPA: hypothetical protein VGN98_02770 [Tianweitania sediminis]|nr:hypothetical protein [Tianweitania sediminis]